ncbi:MAG: hypothetical protein J0M15_13715 [Deltaproteobacteria bacterium]|nr:hypothetical protein [Deltaproteobacteria bacterium]
MEASQSLASGWLDFEHLNKICDEYEIETGPILAKGKLKEVLGDKAST